MVDQKEGGDESNESGVDRGDDTVALASKDGEEDAKDKEGHGCCKQVSALACKRKRPELPIEFETSFDSPVMSHLV